MKTRNYELRIDRDGVVTRFARVFHYSGKPVGLEMTQSFYGESWQTTLLLDGEWTEEEIETELGIGYHYAGAGRGFSRQPTVESNGHSTLVTQTGGIDI